MSNPFEKYKTDPAFTVMNAQSQMRDIAIAQEAERKCRASLKRLCKKYGVRGVYYCLRTGTR